MPLNKKYDYEKRMFDSNKTYDLFISHSYLDKEIINALYYTFEACGYTVFIDWKNEKLMDRNQVSKQVAKKLKIYMANCKGLLYIATENSSNSKWCPWDSRYNRNPASERQLPYLFPIQTYSPF